MSLAFIDSNIFMYAVGAPHPYKVPSENVIRKILSGQISGVTNVEVLQEILYRYGAIRKPKLGYEVFDQIILTFRLIWPIETEDLIMARKLQEKHDLKTRDALHIATMVRYHVKTLYSYDKDFDRFKTIKRLQPFL